MTNLREWLTLYLAPGISAAACRRLVGHFGSPARVLAANRRDLAAVPGLRQESLTALAETGRQTLTALAAREIVRTDQEQIAIITMDMTAYPEALRHIHNPPVLLYVKGAVELLRSSGLGVVGSRAATGYGRRVAHNLAFGLAQQGFTIISGLAMGIDEEAHRGALAAGGKTIAVLGCGLDIVYPPANRKLFQEIAGSGALVSEYPLGTKPEGFRFPSRNRIISGLSLGVVVVEATSRSGSLITAKHALDQGREVFAVPGQVDSVKSAGTHCLLQQGAKLVHNISDITEEFAGHNHMAAAAGPQPAGQAQMPRSALEPQEEKLYAALEIYPKDIDAVVRETGLPPQKVSELLLMLELKGLVEALPGKCYQKT